jgi:hypothetical protein
MEIKQNKFAFFANFAETIQQLPIEKQAEAYKAICEYGIYDKLPEDESLRMMCLMAKASIHKEDGRKNNGGNHNPKGINQHSNLGQIRTNQDKEDNSGQFLSKQKQETETETETRKGIKQFDPPTKDEVLTFAKEMNEMAGVGGFRCSKVLAETFFGHYDSQGWIVGNGIPMWNWQAKLREWASRETQKEITATGAFAPKIAKGER